MTRAVILEADGGSRGNPGPAGYGVVVRDEAGGVLLERAEGIGRSTNNVAEYRGLIAGLRAAAELGATSVAVRMDSKLVVEQMAGRWRVKHPDLQPLAREAAALVRQLGDVRFEWVPRERNAAADRLANEAMDAAAGRPRIPPAAERPRAPGAASGASPRAEVSRDDADVARGASAATTTWLVRHGETEQSLAGRWPGATGTPLTATGHVQAAALAIALSGAGLAAVICGPLQRTRRTAAAIAAAAGCVVEVDPDWTEIGLGEWEGCSPKEIAARWPEEYAAWRKSPETTPPGGEALTDSARRIRRARTRVLSAYGGRAVAIVTHAGPIKTLMRAALDGPPTAMHRVHVDPGSLSCIQWRVDGTASVRLLNDTAPG